MRRTTGIILLTISTLLLLAAMNQSFINKIQSEKYFDHLYPQAATENPLYKSLFVHTDRWRYGDLYGLCYLHQYKFQLEPFKRYTPKPNRQSTNRVLYIIGDSFLADKTLSGGFDDFDQVIFLDRRFAFGPVVPDTTKKNYLIMEFAERNLNGYDIIKTDEVRWTDQEIRSGVSIDKTRIPPQRQPSPDSYFQRLNKIIFNHGLSRNLELILFDNKMATPFKEAKAALNYNLFGRVANEVAVSTDKKRLFLNYTVDTASMQSAFKPKTGQAINTIAHNLEVAGSYYRAIGFRKVFLSVIPNPVAVYDENRMPYNHLLERVEERTNLPVVSLFKTFKADQRNLFYRSDAHWTPLGMDVWVNETNKVLKMNLN